MGKCIQPISPIPCLRERNPEINKPLACWQWDLCIHTTLAKRLVNMEEWQGMLTEPAWIHSSWWFWNPLKSQERDCQSPAEISVLITAHDVAIPGNSPQQRPGFWELLIAHSPAGTNLAFAFGQYDFASLAGPWPQWDLSIFLPGIWKCKRGCSVGYGGAWFQPACTHCLRDNHIHHW